MNLHPVSGRFQAPRNLDPVHVWDILTFGDRVL